jgi:hypothetical protein
MNLTHFTPHINPAEFIDDPDDVKPSDWVDSATIPDPDAVKPDDWDESQPSKIADKSAVKPAAWDEEAPAMIPDPSAVKPEDWDDEEVSLLACTCITITSFVTLAPLINNSLGFLSFFISHRTASGRLLWSPIRCATALDAVPGPRP